MRRCRHCKEHNIPKDAPKAQWWCCAACKFGYQQEKRLGLRQTKAKAAKPAKKKQKSIAKLVDEAAVLLQKLVRMKAADSNGWCKCVTCDQPQPVSWKELQGGHFIQRNKTATKVLEENIHPQCMTCNRWTMKTATGVLAYRRYMVSMYGEQFVSELEIMAKQPRKYTRHEVEGIIFDFKRQIAEQEKRLSGIQQGSVAA